MDLKIKNKNVLIVGASKGIGRSITIAFAEENTRITTIARSCDLLLSLQREISEINHLDHAFYIADLINENPNALAKKIIEERGVFDIVVHNVGGSLVSNNPLGTIEEWFHAWRFNAGIAIDMNNILIHPMIEKGWGRVIHISSISGVYLRGNPLYASSKAFLNAYVTSVGRYIANKGIIMSAVLPGAITFPGGYWDKKAKEQPNICQDFLRHHQAVNRFGTTKEIADVVLFLASENASFMHSALVPVDGGNM